MCAIANAVDFISGETSHEGEASVNLAHQAAVEPERIGKLAENAFINDRCTFIQRSVSEAVPDFGPGQFDEIYHLAAAVGVKLIVESPVRTIETNVNGTQMVLEAACRKRKLVFAASTSEVYGKNTNIP